MALSIYHRVPHVQRTWGTQPFFHTNVLRYENGQGSQLGFASFSPRPTAPYTLRVVIFDDNGTDTIKVYTDGNLQLTVTDNDPLPAGRVAFGGNDPGFDDVKIGYDTERDRGGSVKGDHDIADAGVDEVVWSESFGSTSDSAAYDHAGNLIDDGNFQYVYDAWNRLVKVRAKEDTDVTIQTAEFDGTGRRIKKTASNSGDFDQTVVYLYEGQKIIETRDGSGGLVQQVIHGTQYIDEIVMVRVANKGDLYVHQDANWNVIGLTDLGSNLVERYVYTPYGEPTVHQETGYGDYDGDGDVDSADRAAIETGGACLGGSPPAACRILDLDFDGDYDQDDRDAFDSLPQGPAHHPGRIATNVDQPFAHQGLLYEPEIGVYQNRYRHQDPSLRSFLQRDPLANLSLITAYQDGLNLYAYLRSRPVSLNDPLGLKSELVCTDGPGWGYIEESCCSPISNWGSGITAGLAQTFCCGAFARQGYQHCAVAGCLHPNIDILAPAETHNCIIEHELEHCKHLNCCYMKCACCSCAFGDQPLLSEEQRECIGYARETECLQKMPASPPVDLRCGFTQCMASQLCFVSPRPTVKQAAEHCEKPENHVPCAHP